MKMNIKAYLYALLPGLILTVPCLATDQNALVDKDFLDPSKISYLRQNWSEQDRQYFYFTDQGSRFISYDIFINIEQHNNPDLFRNPENMMRFGYIPVPPTTDNPDGLPIGFVRYKDKMGFTCAACHTQQLRYKDHIIRVDGGQSMADMPMFLDELEMALAESLHNDDKFNRLVIRINGENAPDKKREEFKQSLKINHEKIKIYNRHNHTDVAYGYSRVDAVGRILNKGLFLTGVPDNFNPPDAPVSYPYLWDTPQHDYVEWDGAQSNSDVGALARNVGEVIGVFGEVNTEPKKWLFFIDGGYESSIQARNLRKLERVISKLYSPLWPEIFPPIDQKLAETGRQLYKQYCSACHVDIDRTDPDRRIIVRMSTLDTIKTDPVMAQNVLNFTGKTGIFEGKKRFYIVGDVMGDEAPALFIVNNVMVGVLKNNPVQSLLAKRDAKKMGHPDVIHPPKYVNGEIIEHGQEVSERALLAYKARPLNGIWAGGPHLHNGSVPNLYQLLLPAAERDKTFYIGSWKFDPVNVGYSTEPAPGAFLFDTTLPGNSNSGHEYGTGYDGLAPLTDEDRWALVEYMKIL
jgi:hypothetical protein